MPNANRDKAFRTERDVAAYLRAQGLPDAERRIVTGWHSSTRQLADEGDLRGTPGICVQCKNRTETGPLVDKQLERALAETLAQCRAVGAAIPLLVEKRRMCADPGRWLAWLPNSAYAGLMLGVYPDPAQFGTFPVRIELQHVVTRLVEFSRFFSALQSASTRAG